MKSAILKLPAELLLSIMLRVDTGAIQRLALTCRCPVPIS
jgi:hypothetical protein